MANPMLQNEICLFVMTFLDLPDLVTCRRVSKSWNTCASIILNKKYVIAPFTDDWQDTARFCRIRDKYVESNNYGWPTNLKLNIGNDSSMDNGLEIFDLFGSHLQSVSLITFWNQLNATEVYRARFEDIMELRGLKKCKTLKLQNLRASLVSDFSRALFLPPTLTSLEIFHADLKTDEFIFTDKSYYSKILNLSPLLLALKLQVSFDNYWTDNTLEELLQFAESFKSSLVKFILNGKLTRLLHLSILLDWDGGDALGIEDGMSALQLLDINFEELTPAPFALKRLELNDLYSKSLYEFIKSQSGSLEVLDIGFSWSESRGTMECTHPFDLPPLPNLISLVIPYYYGDDESMRSFSLSAKFPKLINLWVFGLCLYHYDQDDDDHEVNQVNNTFLNGPSQEKSIIKRISIHYSSKFSPDRVVCTDAMESFWEHFSKLEDVKILYACNPVLYNFMRSQIALNLVKLEITGSLLPLDGNLESQLTGYNMQVSEHLNSFFLTADVSHFGSFASNTWNEICKEEFLQQCDTNIGRFSNLQFLKVSDNATTNVLFLFAIKMLEKLVALTLNGKQIRSDLALYMKLKVLPLGFYLQLEIDD